MKFLLSLLFITSCAHKTQSTKRSVIDEVNDGNISVQTILDLARSSYLKGCVDSKNYWNPDRTFSAFKICKEMAKAHEGEINSIINNNTSVKKR